MPITRNQENSVFFQGVFPKTRNLELLDTNLLTIFHWGWVVYWCSDIGFVETYGENFIEVWLKWERYILNKTGFFYRFVDHNFNLYCWIYRLCWLVGYQGSTLSSHTRFNSYFLYCKCKYKLSVYSEFNTSWFEIEVIKHPFFCQFLNWKRDLKI